MKTYENMVVLQAISMALAILGVLGLVAAIEDASMAFGISSIVFLLVGGFIGFYPYLEF